MNALCTPVCVCANVCVCLGGANVVRHVTDSTAIQVHCGRTIGVGAQRNSGNVAASESRTDDVVLYANVRSQWSVVGRGRVLGVHNLPHGAASQDTRHVVWQYHGTDRQRARVKLTPFHFNVNFNPLLVMC